MALAVNSKYESDKGTIHSIRMTAEYAAVAGTEPQAAVNSDIKVKISKSNREFGLRPRGVTLVRVLGTAPNQFKKYTFLPLRSKTDAADAAYSSNAIVAIDGVDWKVVSTQKEDY
jgi:hypothetical protein